MKQLGVQDNKSSLLWESLICMVCLIFNAPDFFLSASVSLCLPDLKVTGLRFMVGICCESLSSVYLRMQRFGLPPPHPSSTR